ncbi:MAG TPA: pilus assembly protein PilV [Usitatibacteraceae bacterium]|nr:pilus assembly protein PilV [Usitatibacteraceae bacterium]
MKPKRSDQEGVVLLEALIGILIFSLGILALVAMQAVSISNVSNARYRTEAAFLANEIIGQIWVDRGVSYGNVGGYAITSGSTASAKGDAWLAKVYAMLPGSNANPPDVAVAVPANGGRQVTVTVRWRAPDAVSVSNHTAVAFISDP